MRSQKSLAAATSARKKSSQKSTRPRGAKDAVTFPGAIGRNNACVRADLQQVALGGRKRLSRVGECIVADGRLPCQRQPLRGYCLPSRGVNPSTWFFVSRAKWVNPFNKQIAKTRQSKQAETFTTTCLLLTWLPCRGTCAGHPCPRRGPGRYVRPPKGVKPSFSPRSKIKNILPATDAGSIKLDYFSPLIA
jgi:hypothetical protein